MNSRAVSSEATAATAVRAECTRTARLVGFIRRPLWVMIHALRGDALRLSETERNGFHHLLETRSADKLSEPSLQARLGGSVGPP